LWKKNDRLFVILRDAITVEVLIENCSRERVFIPVKLTDVLPKLPLFDFFLPCRGDRPLFQAALTNLHTSKISKAYYASLSILLGFGLLTRVIGVMCR